MPIYYGQWLLHFNYFKANAFCKYLIPILGKEEQIITLFDVT